MQSCFLLVYFIFFLSENAVTLQKGKILNANTQMGWGIGSFWVESDCGALEFRFALSDHLGSKHIALSSPSQLVSLASIKQDILQYRPFQLPQWSCVSRLLVYKHSHFLVQFLPLPLFGGLFKTPNLSEHKRLHKNF